MEVKIRGLSNATVAALNKAAEEEGVTRNEYLKRNIELFIQFPLLKEQENRYINLIEKQENRYKNLVEKMVLVMRTQNQRLEEIELLLNEQGRKK